MSERTFFRGHSVLKSLAVDHVIEGKVVKLMTLIKENNEIWWKAKWSISTVLITIKTERFRSLEKVRLGLLNWSFGF